MSEPFLGEIRLFAGNFPPRGWAFCNGQHMAINQNQALFSILGTTYGGNGVQTFALPDLQGRVPMHPGPRRPLGEGGGRETVTLGVAEMPAHQHAVAASAGAADSTDPRNGAPAVARVPTYGAGAPVAMQAGLAPAGVGLPHDNMGPFTAVSFIIALEGIFPVRQ